MCIILLVLIEDDNYLFIDLHSLCLYFLLALIKRSVLYLLNYILTGEFTLYSVMV